MMMNNTKSNKALVSSLDDEMSLRSNPTSICSTTKTSKNNKKSKMRVRFDERVQCRLWSTNYTEDEKQKCWFSGHEYDEIMQSCEMHILMMEQGMELDDDQYCERGLEKHVGDVSEFRRYYQQMARDAVLITQLQYHQGNIMLCSEWDLSMEIAHTYRQHTADCQQWASIVGLCDQRAVQKLRKEEIVASRHKCLDGASISRSRTQTMPMAA